ncbi:hypothetical protein GCM10018780_87650 [Streptomyces lanatus]|nr:hypothetical protein GCM10018780_87650 [Streptomyces lanatus]
MARGAEARDWPADVVRRPVNGRPSALLSEGVCEGFVEQFPQGRGRWCDGGGEQGRAAGQWCEDGAPLPGAWAEQDGAAPHAHLRVDEQELADGTVSVQDGRAVPAGLRVPVRRLLVEQRSSGTVDKESADEVAGILVGPAQKLFFPQQQACSGGEFDRAGLPEVAVGSADQRLGQPAQAGVFPDGEPYVVGGRGGGRAAQGECGGGRRDLQGGPVSGGDVDGEPVAAEGALIAPMIPTLAWFLSVRRRRRWNGPSLSSRGSVVTRPLWLAWMRAVAHTPCGCPAGSSVAEGAPVTAAPAAGPGEGGGAAAVRSAMSCAVGLMRPPCGATR